MDKKSAIDTTESAKEEDSAPSKLSVLASFPQLPKPVLNLRAIPKVMATSLSSAVMSSSATKSCGSRPQTNTSLTTTAGTKFGVNDRFCNGAAKLESAVSKSVALSNGDLGWVSSSTTPICSTLKELSTSVKGDVTYDASLQEIKCEASENGAVVSPAAKVTSTSASPQCDHTSNVSTEIEKQSYGCSDEVPVRNGKLKFIFTKSDIGGNSGQQIQLPVVALERTTLTEITPTVSLSASFPCSKLRPRQHASVHFSSSNAVRTRHGFGRQRITNLRKSARVSDNWKPSVPVLRIPVNRPRKVASHHFCCKRSLSRGTRLVDQKLQKKALESKDLAYDCFSGQRAVTQSRHNSRQFVAISSGAGSAAISTRSQRRQILKHSVVR